MDVTAFVLKFIDNIKANSEFKWDGKEKESPRRHSCTEESSWASRKMQFKGWFGFDVIL